MPDANREGLKAAGKRFAQSMKSVARVKSSKAAEAVNTKWDGDEILIRAGRPGGEYGWIPVQAIMFEDNLRHPLYGNKGHWYRQGRYPITQYTERAGIDGAMDDYADAAIPIILRQHGFK